MEHRIAEASAKDPSHLVVLCHGFGAGAEDLMPLAGELNGALPARWVFPAAPFPPAGAGLPYGRAWFPRSPEEAQRALVGDYFARLEEMDPDGLRASGAEVAELVQSFGIPWSRVILGGFSQGAMVAVETALAAAERPGGLLLFSGSLIARSRWQRELGKLGGLPAFQSHGDSDPILAPSSGERLAHLLEKNGLTVRFHRFPGGHEIESGVVRGAQAFLLGFADVDDAQP